MEDSLIWRATAGDQLAFQQLLEAHNAVVWRTAQVLLSSRLSLEDVVQEVWLDVWRGLPRFQTGRPFRPWLLTVVANRCRMIARRRQALMQLLAVQINLSVSLAGNGQRQVMVQIVPVRA